MGERQSRPRLDQIGVLRSDAHRLRPDQVTHDAHGDYLVEGYRERLPADNAMPSQDGEYWIFYRDNLDGSRSAVFCFFVPMNF